MYPDMRDTWDWLLESAGRRFTIVRHAEQLRHHERVPLLLASLPELASVLFVSGDPDFASVKGPGGQKQLVPHLAAIRDAKSGQLIRCCRPGKEEELLKLVASWWPGAGLNLAARVMDWCGDDLNAAYGACELARRSGLPAHEEQLPLACQQYRPGSGFADLVITGKTRAALAVAADLSESDALLALGKLNAGLAQIRSYASWKSSGLPAGEIEKRGISRYRQRLLAPDAGRYGPDREIRCRHLLASAEEALRSGARTGVLEALAVLWG